VTGTDPPATVTIIGVDGAGNFASATGPSVPAKGSAAIGTWSKILEIRITGGANRDFNITQGTKTRVTFGDVAGNAYVSSTGIPSFPEGDRALHVHSNNSTSNPKSQAVITLTGVSSTVATPFTEVISLGGSGDADGAQMFSSILRIQIENAASEIITLSTMPQYGPDASKTLLGNITVLPLKFQPAAYQNESGTYFFGSMDIIHFSILNESVLGDHDMNWTFYDRFNNSFDWNQPFKFVLPTSTILTVTTKRDDADANKTHVCLSALLLYQKIDDPLKMPLYPLGGQVMHFYEYKVVTNDDGEPVETPEYAQDDNDGSMGCMCPDGGCVGQCSETADCLPVDTYVCMYPQHCTVDTDCPEGVPCEAGDYGSMVCHHSGRCSQAFGFLEKNTTCTAADVAASTNNCWKLGEASYCYDVCGWGRHTAFAVFNASEPEAEGFGRSMDVQAYYAGGLSLSAGPVSLVAAVAMLLSGLGLLSRRRLCRAV